MPTLFQAEGPGWRLEIVGKLPELPPFLDSTPNSTIKADGILKMHRIDASGLDLRVLNSDEAMEPLFYEAIGYDIHFERDDLSASIDLPYGADPRRIRATVEHYYLNFGNNVGFADINIKTSSEDAHIRLEVFSRKVDYRTDYMVMREEVSSMLRNLAMSANSKTWGMASPEKGRHSTLVEWFALIKKHFKEFTKLAYSIAKNPHSALVKKTISIDSNRARRVSRKTIDQVMRRPNVGPIHIGLSAPLPLRIQEIRSWTTFDTNENRYFKALIKETHRKIRLLAATQYSGNEDADMNSEARFFSSIRNQLIEMQKQVEALMRTPFLKQVSDSEIIRPESMVFHKHPIYSSFEKLCKILNGGLSFANDILPIGVKDTAILYEYWCFLKLVSLLGNHFELEEQNVVQFKHLRTVVALKKGKSSAIRFVHRPTGKELRIVYNRMFNKLPTLAQQPDNVIQLASQDRFYIFDAKYRIQFDKDYLKRHEKPGPTEDDVNTMHRYRDAIAIPHPVTGEYQRGVVMGAAVLFPHPNEADYSGHRFHKSLDQIEIGGIPFLPQSTSILEHKIAQLLMLEYSLINP